jgi:anti-sigma factor RsiW
MNCRDFSEIADSYLSNELLVETNHDVIRHLEDCRECRTMLAERRALRERLKRAIVEARESHVDTAFAAKLKEGLRSSVSRPRPMFAGFRLAFAAAAVLLVAVFGLILLRSAS